MSNFIKVGAAALNQTPLDWKNNVDNICNAIKEAKKENVSILCLPELCITGYGCEDAFLAEYIYTNALHCLEYIRPHTINMVVSVGLPLRINNALYNCIAILSHGKLVGIVPKQNLASDGLHYEPRWFKAWPAGKKSELNFGKLKVPVGDLVFSVNGIRFGFEVCEDAWVVNRPGNSLAKRSVDIILNPSASHFAFGKSETRKGFVIEGSRAFHCTYVYANLLGNEAGRAIYDGDTMIAQNGKLKEVGKRFSFKDFTLTYSVVDVGRSRTQRISNGSFRPDFVEPDVNITCSFSDPGSLSLKEANHKTYDKFYEFEMASSLGLFDYMRKSKSNGFVLSLSGGADSSAVACIISAMVKNGLTELGREGFIERSNVSYDLSSDKESDYEAIMSNILTCIYQSTENSSQETLESAEHLSKNLGASFAKWSVDDVKDSYTNKVQNVLGRQLSWGTDDVALQNIQARVRAPGIWMIANIKNALLLATSNRSEAAVGYATMDGDTCGGLSPIAGISKEFILDWLDSLLENNLYFSDALQSYKKLKPTAELRPKDMNQTDEDDLMPYPILEKIEVYAIRDKMSPEEILTYISDSDYSKEQLVEWITKFFTLWSHNQWKRERYAPSFHFDDENLDPKTWCRWPILSGNLV